jgi:peptidoglycan glycosyltransferase
MSGGSRRAFAALLTGTVFSGSMMGLAMAGGNGPALPMAASVDAAPVLMGRTRGEPSLLLGFNPLIHRLAGTRLVSDLPSGNRAVLTLDPGLQLHLSNLLRSYQVPFAAVVAIVPSSGRVLAYVSHSSANPGAGDLVRDPTPPSASVFKLITASALLDSGVQPSTKVCYGGGARRLLRADLVDNRARDRSCATLGEGVGYSINAVLAKLADRKLDRARLARYAHAFGFGRELAFDAPTRASPAEFPEDRLELARAAAGFWHVHMSPLHAALIAATIANGGTMPRPSMVDRVLDPSGRVLREFEPRLLHSAISRATAKALGQMMLTTVTRGTSREAFHDARGRAFLPGISVAGKTGTLSSDRPFRAYSWWVGYAPEEAPSVAVAALIVNTSVWRIKAGHVAREALRYQLLESGSRQAHTEAERPGRIIEP